jgi:O-antigen chain-terminating methyltransferase
LPTESDEPGLEALARKLEAEEKAYADVIDAVDRFASFALPAESLPDLPARLAGLNETFAAPGRPAAGGLGGAFRARAYDAVQPALERQTEWNALVVQILNGYVGETEKLHARLRELASAVVKYVQRVQPLVDARDRMTSALATTRSELVLEAFDRRLESLGRRLTGLLALRDRLETVSEEMRAVRGTLAADAPAPTVAAAAARAADDAVYTAFENRYRGSRDEIRERMRGYVPLFEGLAPVVDLGCGRGEFLELLKERGIAARGVEGNANVVRECREKGLDVVSGDLVDFLRAEKAGTLGGVFAAQVAEHLPPPVLQVMVSEAHRVLRPGGLLLLETVNPRSVVGLLEVFNRDLTHQRPLHPDTLSFLAAAMGFTDVRVEMRTPVEASARLQPVPAEGLPERTAAVLNENLERLNALLYGPLEYALYARR